MEALLFQFRLDLRPRFWDVLVRLPKEAPALRRLELGSRREPGVAGLVGIPQRRLVRTPRGWFLEVMSLPPASNTV